MERIIESLNWRYATKKFDATKKVSNEDLNALLEALNLAPSSYGLQPYKFLVIENQEIRAKLLPASYGQSQIVDASHMVLICAKIKLLESDIDTYVSHIAKTRSIQEENLKGFGDTMKSTLLSLPPEKLTAWAIKQSYLAAGVVLTAAGDLKIDTCPMEGFVPAQYTEILGLEEKNLLPVQVITIGYRSTEDQTQHMAKVRKEKEDIVEYI